VEIVTFAEYQIECLRTAGNHTVGIEHLACWGLGVAGETGEIVDLYWEARYVHHDTIDRSKLCLELGDLLWYVTASARTLGYDLSEIASRGVRLTPMSDSMDRYQRGRKRKRLRDMETSHESMDGLMLLLSSQCGRFADTVKKVVYHHKPLVDHRVDLISRLVAALALISDISTEYDIKLTTIATENSKKLRARYPRGWQDR